MLLIFDCDGVLLDSVNLHTEIESETYQKLGIKISPKELARRFAGVPQVEVSRTLARETGLTIPPGFDVEVEKHKEMAFTQRIKTIPHIHDTLTALSDFPCCIASGSGMATLKHALSLVGLYNHFAPHIYSSELVAKGKPAPDLFLYAANKMGFAPDECLVIEDGAAGVQAAVNAHMRVFGFVGGCHCDDEQGERLKAEGAEIVFSDMRELPTLIGQKNK